MAQIAAKALGWLLIAWFAELPANAVAAPRCDGIEIAVAADAPRCFRPGAGQWFKDCPDCPEMVVVPAGGFTMGPPPDEEVATVREDQTQVNIAGAFAVGRFAVTRGEFAAFVAATGHNTEGGCYRFDGTASWREADRSWRSPGFTQTDRHPVVCVSWNDAQAYLAWLSSSTGRRYRLLSETEREYVARAGSTTPFWWGATISTEQANYDGRIAYGGGAAVSGARQRWRWTVSPPIRGASTTCTATSGNGRRIAGTTTTPAIRRMAARGLPATAVCVSCAAAAGRMHLTRCARQGGAGTRRTRATASSVFAWRERCRAELPRRNECRPD
jgi:formylglycine-generating enzyme required for sulfatase activity